MAHHGTLSEQLNRLLKSGQLIRIERGVYKLSDDAKKDFVVVCSEEMRRINQQIKTLFPFAAYCIWPEISSFTLHAPYT